MSLSRNHDLVTLDNPQTLLWAVSCWNCWTIAAQLIDKLSAIQLIAIWLIVLSIFFSNKSQNYLIPAF